MGKERRTTRAADREARAAHAAGETKTRFYPENLLPVKPLTPTQEDLFHAFPERHLMLHGLPGTGKTFLGMYLALRQVLETHNQYKRLCIIRSIVPTRDIGYLKGTEEEKMAAYEAPYRGICDKLLPYSKSYENLKRGGYIHFDSTSFRRGVTLDNCIVLVDEAQNNTLHELDTLITRLGENTRIIFSGDTGQSDLGPQSGLPRFMQILQRLDQHFVCIDFHRPEDIVRSGVVRDYILAKQAA